MSDCIRPKPVASIQSGAPLSLVDIALTISKEEIIESGVLIENSEQRTINTINLLYSKFKEVREDILAFQTILSFYDITKYRKLWAERNIFDFSYEIKSTNKIKLDKSSADESVDEDNYIIVIKVNPQKDLLADFNIDYALCDIQNMKWICKSFKNNFRNGVIEQLILALHHKENCRMNKEEIINNSPLLNKYFLYDKIKKWEAKYKSNIVFPVNNVELIYNIEKKLEEKAVYFDAERIFDIIKDIFDCISQELKVRDKYLGRDSYQYNYFKPFKFYPVVYMFIKKNKYIEVSLQKMFKKLPRPLDFQHDVPLMD